MRKERVDLRFYDENLHSFFFGVSAILDGEYIN